METNAFILLNYVSSNLPDVASMARPLDEKQLEQLIKRFGYDAVKRQLENMENKIKPGQYKSAFLTCLKWFELDEKRGYINHEPDAKNQKNQVKTDAETYLERHPIGSEVMHHGIMFIVEDNTFLRNKLTGDLLPIHFLFKNKGGR